MRYLLSFILVALLAAPAMGAKSAPQPGEEGPVGGFEGPVRGAQAETVEKALQLAHDSRVILAGNIIASVAGEKNQYIFKDATGELTIVIPPKQFKGQTINPETKVRIGGKLEKGPNIADGARVRVNQLEIVK